MNGRNLTADVVRGLAMLLVVLGHTVTHSATEYVQTPFYQAIWTLQMPLFVVVSGYVMRYSKPLPDAKSLLRALVHKTLAYMLPWLVWTFVIRGCICREQAFLHPGYMLWHMDSGYWFLAVIWLMSIAGTVANYACGKVAGAGNGGLKRAAVAVGVMLAAMAVLAGIGKLAGMSFFGIRLALYYFPFFIAGMLFGRMGGKLPGPKAVAAALALACAAFWLVMIFTRDFYTGGDDIASILLRYLSSACGCVAVASLVSACVGKTGANPLVRALDWVGRHSLEIYLVHYLFLSMVKTGSAPTLGSWKGVGIVAGNFALTLAATVATILIVRRFKILRESLFFR